MNKIKAYKKRRYFVLIVEDDRSLEPLWNLIMSKLNFDIKIDWATSVAEAENFVLSSLKSENLYDLVILDIFLDGFESGLDLVTKYEYIFENKILITSGTNFQLYEDYKNFGASGPFCLPKPIDPEQTIKFLTNILH